MTRKVVMMLVFVVLRPNSLDQVHTIPHTTNGRDIVIAYDAW